MLLGLLALVGVCVVVVAGLFAKTFSGLQPKSEDAFADGSRPILDGYVGTFAIPTAEAGKVILVDCGNDKTGAAVKANLAAHHESVVAILLTHGHPDHIGGCTAIAPGAPVYAHKAEVDVIEGRAGFRGPVPRLFGMQKSDVKVTHAVDDDADLDVAGVHVKALHVPGHTAGSVIWVAGRTLFFGDAATAKDDGTIAGPPWLFSDDTAVGDASIKALPAKLAALHIDVDTFAFAHAGALKADMKLLENLR